MEIQGDFTLCATSTDVIKRFAVIKSVIIKTVVIKTVIIKRVHLSSGFLTR